MSQKDSDAWLDVAAFMELGDLPREGALADEEVVSHLEAEGLTVRSFDDLFEISEE